jgi:hypothetical protein
VRGNVAPAFDGSGLVSDFLLHGAGFVPIAGRVARGAAVGALGTGLAAALVYAWFLDALRARGSREGRSALLAASAALSAVLATPWQEDAVSLGGGWAAPLALATVVAARNARGDARRGALVGALLALTAGQSLGAGVAAGVGTLVVVGFARGAFVPGWLGAAAAGFAVPMTVAVAARAGAFLPAGWAGLELSALGAGGSGLGPLTLGDASSVGSAGFLPLGLAALGVFGLVLQARTRGTGVLVAVWCALSALFEGPLRPLAPAEWLPPLGLLANASVFGTTAVGIVFALELVERAELPFTRQVSALAVVFSIASALVTGETSRAVLDRSRSLGAEAWTDAALLELPRDSVLFQRSPELAARIAASRIARGERPDVIALTPAWLGSNAGARALITREPALAGLVRDQAVAERVAEYTLSALADARPLFVEVDATWPERIVEHVMPAGVWARISPHAVGPSDRVQSLERARASLDRIAERSRLAGGTDALTRGVLERAAREQLVALRTARDTAGEAALVAWLARVGPDAGDADGRVTGRP